LFGAAGDVGSRIAAEAVSRGHEVTGVVRKKEQIDSLPDAISGQHGNAGDLASVTQLTAGQDLIISAIRPPAGSEHLLPELTKTILEGAAKTNTRVLIIGGAASRKVPGLGGHTVLTAPNFLPPSVLDIARACQAQYEIIIADTKANWSYFCPPAMLTPGVRTGQYRLGLDELVIDANGQSAISMEDFAVALIDEAEQPKHIKASFTAAY
ncbi:MAG: NAD(P)H-binding protein, partial [Sneathiella sp.]|nr:NAD(P)H-binding protein [Sneathiella sp.]